MITLTFNPYAHTNGTSIIFKHPIVAKFYLLWRKTHLTEDLFVKRCKDLCQHINPANELYGIDDFIEALRKCNAIRGTGKDTKWIINHWSYFSPNIRRSLEFKHKYRGGEKTSKIS